MREDPLYEFMCAEAHRQFPAAASLADHSNGDTSHAREVQVSFRLRKQLRLMMDYLTYLMKVLPEHYTRVGEIRRIPRVVSAMRAKQALRRFQDVYDAERREGGTDSAAKYLAGSLFAAMLLEAYDHRKTLDLEQATYLFFSALDGKGSKEGIGQLLNEMRDTR